MRQFSKYLLLLTVTLSLYIPNLNAQFTNPLDTVAAEKRTLLQHLEMHTSQVMLADIYLKVFALDLQNEAEDTIEHIFYHRKETDKNTIANNLNRILSAEELSTKISAILAEKLTVAELREVNRLYTTPEGQYQTTVMCNFVKTGYFSPDLKKLEAFDQLTENNAAFRKWNLVYEATAEQLAHITHEYVKEKTQAILRSE